jgi:hypothetical protein
VTTADTSDLAIEWKKKKKRQEKKKERNLKRKEKREEKREEERKGREEKERKGKKDKTVGPTLVTLPDLSAKSYCQFLDQAGLSANRRLWQQAR